MSSSETSLKNRRSVLALFAVLPLAACGFTPVYGPGGAGNALRGQVEFAEPRDGLDFDLVSQLEDRIGRPNGARYRLDYEIRTSESALAVTVEEDINRINITGVAAFTLTDLATGEQVQGGEVSTFTAFASSGSPVAIMAARRDAETRLATILADRIVTRLLAGAPAQA